MVKQAACRSILTLELSLSLSPDSLTPGGRLHLEGVQSGTLQNSASET